MKVLVADDSLMSRHLMQTTLSRWDYEVVLVGDGLEALRVLSQADAPPIAILDWMMPGLTGLEVCRQVRSWDNHPYCYILMLTAKNRREDLIAGLEAGADDYIFKPFDHHELKVRLRAGRRLIELQTELLSAREALMEQATKDSLTGMWNRPTILERFRTELSRAGRESRPLGVVLVDLDHFKNVNDTFGHFAGDAVLQEASVRMRHSIRAYDSIGRYGGEEFLVLLPGCDEKATLAQAERLRTVLQDSQITVGGAKLLVTASFGCTTALPGSSFTGDGLIRKADEALYSAKRLGRNRVEFFSSTTELIANAVVPVTAVNLALG